MRLVCISNQMKRKLRNSRLGSMFGVRRIQGVLSLGTIAVIAWIGICVVATVGFSQNLNPAVDRIA